jgi:hypothetical protein
VSARAGPRRPSSALGVYVIVLLSLQIFLVTVAVDALQTDDEALAWTAAGVSVALAAGAVLFARSLGGRPRV